MSLETAMCFEKDLQSLIDTYSILLDKQWVKEIVGNELWRLEGASISLKDWYSTTTKEEPVKEEPVKEEEEPMLPLKEDFEIIRETLNGFDWYKDKEVDGNFYSVLKNVVRVKLESANALQIAQACMLARIKNPTPKKEGQARYTPDKALNKTQRNQIWILFGFTDCNLADLEKQVVELYGKQNKEVLKSVQVDTKEEYGEQWMEYVENAHLPPPSDAPVKKLSSALKVLEEKVLESVQSNTEKKKTLSALEKFMNLKK
jgi:hypothetical protein